jgi:hypothetical protein
VATAVADIDGDGTADLLGNVGLGNDRYQINVYRSKVGKSARTRSYSIDDADQVFTTTNYYVEGNLGYLNDSLRRYQMVPFYGPDPRGGARMLAFSGGPDGLNATYDAYYSAASDGLVEASVFGIGIGGPIGDATGDGWDDYITGNPNWYGPLKQGIAILLAGGPYIPNDDPTVSVQHVATSERSDALHLWPNPVRDILHIAWRGDLKRMPARMAVHDISGRVITEGAVQPGRGEALWRCASVAVGTYVLTIYDSRGDVIATERVVKE